MSLDYHAACIASIGESPFAQLAGPGMAVLSLLSEAQELLRANGTGSPLDTEAWHKIDQAKAVIIHYELGLKA